MNDIVTRIRKLADRRNPPDNWRDPLLLEAAAEIERLREELSPHPRCNWCSKTYDRATQKVYKVGGLTACSDECRKHLEMIG